MPRMLPGIETLTQHQERVQNDPDAYRPERCPHWMRDSGCCSGWRKCSALAPPAKYSNHADESTT